MLNRATKSEGLVHVVLGSPAPANHRVMVPRTPVGEDNRVTQQWGHLLLSLRMNLKAFAVVLLGV